MAQQGQNMAAQAAGARGSLATESPADKVLELLRSELHLDERDMAYLYDYLSSSLYRVEADEVEVKLTMSVEASQCRRRGDCTAVTYLTPREALALALRLIAGAEAAISNERKIVESS
jgi:hypothetical protein